MACSFPLAPPSRSFPCFPLPHTVSTVFLSRSATLTEWFSGSATKTEAPLCTHRPCGDPNSQESNLPSRKPDLPLPTTSTTPPSEASQTSTRWLPLSDTSRSRPSGETDTFPGNRRKPALDPGSRERGIVCFLDLN